MTLFNLRVHLPFSKEFPSDYQDLRPKSNPTIVRMKDNLLLKVLMLEHVDRERQDKSNMEMMAKLQKHVDIYNESQRLLDALKKKRIPRRRSWHM